MADGRLFVGREHEVGQVIVAVVCVSVAEERAVGDPRDPYADSVAQDVPRLAVSRGDPPVEGEGADGEVGGVDESGQYAGDGAVGGEGEEKSDAWNVGADGFEVEAVAVCLITAVGVFA